MHNSKETREKNYDWHHFNLTFVSVFPQTSANALIIALFRINTNPLDHNVKQVPPSNKKTPFLSHFFKLVEMQNLFLLPRYLQPFMLHLHRNQYRRIAYFPLSQFKLFLSPYACFSLNFFYFYCLHEEAKLQTKSNVRVSL